MKLKKNLLFCVGLLAVIWFSVIPVFAAMAASPYCDVEIYCSNGNTITCSAECPSGFAATCINYGTWLYCSCSEDGMLTAWGQVTCDGGMTGGPEA